MKEADREQRVQESKWTKTSFQNWLWSMNMGDMGCFEHYYVPSGHHKYMHVQGLFHQ